MCLFLVTSRNNEAFRGVIFLGFVGENRFGLFSVFFVNLVWLTFIGFFKEEMEARIVWVESRV